jgi:glycosyltransferase involved in cell wall biosynthesis
MRPGGGSAPAGLALLGQVLRAEGARAVADRLWDRLQEARRQRSFRPVAAPPAGFSCPILNLSGAPPAPRLGGVQAQLLWRLTEEARLRPVALLYPETGAAAGRYRLDLQRGGERWRLLLPAGEAAATAGQDTGAAAPGRSARRPDAAPGPAQPLEPAVPGVAWQPDPALAGAAMLVDPALERAVAWAAGLCGATALHVEGLAGMPLGSLLRLHQGGIRLLLALHDFAAFCPRPHLLESREPPDPPRFCRYSREPERCARCLGRDFPGLPAGYQEARRVLARTLLESATALVHPSEFLARTHGRLFGSASQAEGSAPAGSRSSDQPSGSWVIAPAAPPTLGAHTTHGTAKPRPGAPRHFAWVGAVQAHKGALVLTAALERLAAAGRPLRVTAYGGGDREILARWRSLPGLRVRGYYRAGSLPALLRRDRIDCALLLSVVPESYGLTLDECAAAGVPVIAFDLGAPGERIAAGSGLLLGAGGAGDPALGGAALAALLSDLRDGRLAPPPPPAVPGPERHPAATARSWCALYRRLDLLPPDA